MYEADCIVEAACLSKEFPNAPAGLVLCVYEQSAQKTGSKPKGK